MFNFDEFWGSLGASIFQSSGSVANNAESLLSSRLSVRFMWNKSFTGSDKSREK